MNLNSEINLSNLMPGEDALIVFFSESLETRFLNRLQEIGFLIGEKIELLQEAPFGRDPISVRVKGGVYAIRRADAEKIIVRKNKTI